MAGLILLGAWDGEEVHGRPRAFRVFVDFQYKILVFEVFAVFGRVVPGGST